MRILFLGDIVSRLGRKAVRKFLPKLRKADNVDLAIGNVENLAGGRGATKETIEEVLSFGLDYCTSGDHIFALSSFRNQIDSLPVLRPANYPQDVPGKGYAILDLGSQQILLINLLGLSVGRENVNCPFRAADKIVSEKGDQAAAIVVDFHSENTSERRALGFYLDGRVSAVLGTHSHIPTADAQILPQGSAYVSDVGMCGPLNSVLGVEKEIIIERFKYPYHRRFEWVKSGPAKLNSVLIDIGKDGLAQKIERRDKFLFEET
ncbi:MAG: TIGR00282 family metallophosphoesterase [Patescibacteria group bacterium]|nr:TIGR00282 family metallophosphoesterase [Patescibacteria group bacterium]